MFLSPFQEIVFLRSCLTSLPDRLKLKIKVIQKFIYFKRNIIKFFNLIQLKFIQYLNLLPPVLLNLLAWPVQTKNEVRPTLFLLQYFLQLQWSYRRHQNSWLSLNLGISNSFPWWWYFACVAWSLDSVGIGSKQRSQFCNNCNSLHTLSASSILFLPPQALLFVSSHPLSSSEPPEWVSLWRSTPALPHPQSKSS